jgi:hypothetical protein
MIRNSINCILVEKLITFKAVLGFKVLCVEVNFRIPEDHEEELSE